MRAEGEPIDRAFRHQKLVERRVVFICDISGSMEPYARALVLFLQAAVATGPAGRGAHVRHAAHAT